ncbi:MAG TPA: glutamine--fructose-6-phosphate transaminase (isomerizing) [Anaerolineales bacterium]|nr:MAG: glutamine--fructose-6-phosphate transaminase (isomerizing) [Anaerolineales bacterium]GIK08699.1 MAG: glutamine--fructose-6-phosphate aminotransferase [Chloroflexota bacterium]HMN00385.1 glutamine--fructose-6-phosphate transaminase (isomerizing) [Anaerolineales bacterium]
MCGIFGYVTNKETALGPILIAAAERLTYRGYDSVGAAALNNGKIDLRKDVGKVDSVAAKYNIGEMRGSRGITQLRWATFGEPSQVNAQPHLDSDGDMVGAHNGNVVNNVELREQFMAEGMTVRSQNDGETCVHAVERYINRGYEFIDAIRLAYGDLEGDYAFVIGRADDDKLYAFKKGSGMVVGLGEGFTCVSSDLPSILPLTREVVRPQDGEIVTLWADKVEVRSVKDGKRIERKPETVTESMDAVQKGGYPHFMLKEIHEQSQVARELSHVLNGNREVESLVEKMKNARNLYFIGCGTSYHAASVGAVYFAQLAGRAAIPVLAPQFIAQYAPAVTHDDVGIFVSQSGETKDVLNALEVAEARGMACFGLANVVGSTLTKATSFSLPLCCGYEISVPATKTFTNQVVTFLYLAYKLAGKDVRELDSIPELMDKTLEMVEPQVKEIAKEINEWNDLYCLGYGATYAIALEGALKLKEITYAHCEGMLSTEFKHGPLSAVSKGFPIVFVAGPNDVPLIISGINEVKVRGARTIVIAEEDSRLRANADDVIALPKSDPQISALLGVLPLQLLSYHMSVMRGFDPDFPRNLSKTLTVD